MFHALRTSQNVTRRARRRSEVPPRSEMTVESRFGSAIALFLTDRWALVRTMTTSGWRCVPTKTQRCGGECGPATTRGCSHVVIQVTWGRDTRPTMPRRGGGWSPDKDDERVGLGVDKDDGQARPRADNGNERVGPRADKGDGWLGSRVEKGDEQMGPHADKGDGWVESSANKDSVHKACRHFTKH
ncbi:hypothetical protein B0H14DRAFT_2601281 [Mycena olivaceomarginata]|nr:hypothetical protein B0H14DRAFT_2601281 [Mycena olivaceomarginata]